MQSVTSSTPASAPASGLAVTYVTAGMCTLTAQTAASTNFLAASGVQQTFTIGQVTPTGPTITNVPSSPTWSSGGGFTAQLGNTDGSDGAQSVTLEHPQRLHGQWPRGHLRDRWHLHVDRPDRVEHQLLGRLG